MSLVNATLEILFSENFMFKVLINTAQQKNFVVKYIFWNIRLRKKKSQHLIEGFIRAFNLLLCFVSIEGYRVCTFP